MPKFLTGINYWPRSSAMYMWKRFDLGEIRDEMAHISSLGLDVVRFFLLWEDFQPTRDDVDEGMLQRLESVMEAIGDAGLRAMPTFFTGHMSGVNFLPEWTLDPHQPHGRFRTYARGRQHPCGIGNFYSGALLDAQELQVRRVAERIGGHPALWAWDLGNEFSNMREPNDEEECANWSRVLTEALINRSQVPVTAGTHGEDITRDRGILLSSTCKPFEFATMHGYSVYSAFSRGRLDTKVVPFLSQIAQSCSRKRVLFSEFGNPTCPPGTTSPYDRVPLPGENVLLVSSVPNSSCAFACLTEDEMCTYAYGVMDGLHKSGALGAFWWCYADYAKELENTPPFDNAPHELTFGMVRQDGSEKPIAQTLKAFAAEEREVAPLPAPIVKEHEYFAHFPESVDEAYTRYVQTTDA
ncbi:MAG: hypothetical protein M3N13_11135 [Candidatus Eremiobacteraeota bacterium]|nr:hypothetical protein [Candidatus Eremiobacteraeota bacterium]